MALQNSGAISLDDIHVEAGGTSGTSASINDSDIRDMIDKSDGAEASFQEYYGASSQTHVAGSGGQTTTSGNYKFHYFNSSGQFQVTSIGSGGPSNTIDYIVIAGGGSGGVSHSQPADCLSVGGGGGAGGYTTGTFSGTVGNHSVTIGGGGSGQTPGSGAHASGSNSSLENVSTATGGGGGGYRTNTAVVNGESGGSGGGGNTQGQIATGISGQGNNGGMGEHRYSNPTHGGQYFPTAGHGGGGGGKGSAAPDSQGTWGAYFGLEFHGGRVAQDGGNGSSTGNANYNSGTRAGGGGGDCKIYANYSNRTAEGKAGGGDGGRHFYTSAGTVLSPTSATANSGSGGGGGNSTGYLGGRSGNSGSGGSGIVMVRYQYQG